jgi:hypothetical protein
MGKLREAKFAIALILAVASLANAATAEELPIPPYKDNKAAIESYWSLRTNDVARSRFSGMPAWPFDRIVIDVRGPHWNSGKIFGGDPATAKTIAARIDDYALRVLQSRLGELGIAHQIQVSLFDGLVLFSSPKEVRECTTLAIEIQFSLVKQPVQDQEVVGLLGDLIASQQSMERDNTGTKYCSVSNPPWVLHNGPRLSLMAEQDEATIEHEIQAQILKLVDFGIVPQIVDSRGEVQALLRSWRDGN